jgi:hypothetical protein
MAEYGVIENRSERDTNPYSLQSTFRLVCVSQATNLINGTRPRVAMVQHFGLTLIHSFERGSPYETIHPFDRK